MSKARVMTRQGRKIYDPDGQNNDRAEWAEDAITAFMSTTSTDREDALADLLADLMHWADRQKGMDFERELQRGRGHYAAETSKTGEDVT